MLKLVIAAVALLIPAGALAQSNYVFDPSSGNSYSIYRNDTGATIQGYNLGTGSMWNQRQNYDGTYSGTDSQGNMYSGNNRSGFYMNYGTGEVCYGSGVTRVCN